MPIYDWPADLVPSAETFRIDARTRSGGETLTGREQVIGSGRARWIANLSVPLFNSAGIRAARRLQALLDGRSNGVRVGPCDCRNGNQLVPFIGHIPYSPDEAFHSDGAGFSQGGVPPGVTAIAAAGATQVQIFVGSTLLPVLEGASIGLGGYMYVIVGVTPADDDNAILDIRPRLRTPLAVDDPVEWCHPRLPMRLLSDDSGSFELQLQRIGTVTYDLVEIY